MLNKKETCPLCNSDQFKKKKKNKELSLGYCLNCSLAYAQPLIRGTDEDVGESNSSNTESAYYKRLKEHHALQTEIAKQKAPKMYEYWKKILGDTSNKDLSILEIGCGTGQYYEAWKEMGAHWDGLEVNKDMLSFCAARNIPVKNINIMDETLPQKYDVIFLSQVLEHVLNPNLFMQKIKSNMSKNSILHIDVPNQDSLTSLYRRVNFSHPEYGFIQPNHHLIAYTKKSLFMLLEKNGFQVKHIKAYSNDHDTFGQLLVENKVSSKISFMLADFLNRGSLLVTLAQKKNLH